MTDIVSTSHANLMDQRAQGKKLHRRTQSSSKHDFNGFINKKAASEEFAQEMIQNQNILNADATQNALDADASRQVGNEIEVIVDDIEDVPYAGFIVPKVNVSNNPLNLISKRNLSARVESLGSLYPVKKIHLLDQLRDNIDEFTGLNTIHEKKSSMDSMDTDTAGARSPGLQSISNSQGSKNPSRTHSKHSSLDIRPGHSKTSSADFRNLNIGQPTVDFRPLSQIAKAEKENMHLTKKPSNFSNLETKEPQVNSMPTFGIVPNRRMNHVRSQQATINNYITKTSETGIVSPKGPVTSINLVDAVSPKNPSGFGIKYPVDKGKNQRNSSKSNTNTQKETMKASESKTTLNLNVNNTAVDSKIANLTESMKNLTLKTDLIENQIKRIFHVVDTFTHERNHLEEKVKAQDEKIKVLMDIASKYEEEINSLKAARSQQKQDSDSNTKINHKRTKEIPVPTVLTTATDISSIESPGSDSSGFYTNKESKEISKTLHFPITPQGQRMFPAKNERLGYDNLNSFKIEGPGNKRKTEY